MPYLTCPVCRLTSYSATTGPTPGRCPGCDSRLTGTLHAWNPSELRRLVTSHDLPLDNSREHRRTLDDAGLDERAMELLGVGAENSPRDDTARHGREVPNKGAVQRLNEIGPLRPLSVHRVGTRIPHVAASDRAQGRRQGAGTSRTDATTSTEPPPPRPAHRHEGA